MRFDEPLGSFRAPNPELAALSGAIAPIADSGPRGTIRGGEANIVTLPPLFETPARASTNPAPQLSIKEVPGGGTTVSSKGLMPVFEDLKLSHKELGKDLKHSPSALNQLGVNAYEQGDFALAKLYFEHAAKELKSDNGRKDDAGKVYYNLGATHYMLSKTPQKYDYYEESGDDVSDRASDYAAQHSNLVKAQKYFNKAAGINSSSSEISKSLKKVDTDLSRFSGLGGGTVVGNLDGAKGHILGYLLTGLIGFGYISLLKKTRQGNDIEDPVRRSSGRQRDPKLQSSITTTTSEDLWRSYQDFNNRTPAMSRDALVAMNSRQLDEVCNLFPRQFTVYSDATGSRATALVPEALLNAPKVSGGPRGGFSVGYGSQAENRGQNDLDYQTDAQGNIISAVRFRGLLPFDPASTNKIWLPIGEGGGVTGKTSTVAHSSIVEINGKKYLQLEMKGPGDRIEIQNSMPTTGDGSGLIWEGKVGDEFNYDIFENGKVIESHRFRYSPGHSPDNKLSAKNANLYRSHFKKGEGSHVLKSETRQAQLNKPDTWQFAVNPQQTAVFQVLDGKGEPIYTYERTESLSLGRKPQPRAIQTALQNAGYDIGKHGVDGKIGKDTRQAIRNYQKDHGLKVNGIVGQRTWGKLEPQSWGTGTLKLSGNTTNQMRWYNGEPVSNMNITTEPAGITTLPGRKLPEPLQRIKKVEIFDVKNPALSPTIQVYTYPAFNITLPSKVTTTWPAGYKLSGTDIILTKPLTFSGESIPFNVPIETNKGTLYNTAIGISQKAITKEDVKGIQQQLWDNLYGKDKEFTQRMKSQGLTRDKFANGISNSDTQFGITRLKEVNLSAAEEWYDKVKKSIG
ncbi:MAG: peptidoglycan-binding protein, partial [Candidatus Omnitrophota bacterium]